MNARTDGEAGEVGVDELLRLLLRDTPMSFASVKACLSVEQRVVDDLGAAAQLVRAEAAVGAEDLQRRPIVDVLAALKASSSASSPDRCASTRSSICE